MPFKLSNNPKIRYAANEMRLFSCLKATPIDTDELMMAYYKDKDPPQFKREAMTATLTQLIRKMAYNGEKVRIVKSDRRGPEPITVHLEERSARIGRNNKSSRQRKSA